MNKRLQKQIESAQSRYAAAPGAPYTQAGAQIWGTTLEAMAESGIAVTPRAIVDRAANPVFPLHPFFEWDNAKAADEYRLHQARSGVNHLLVFTATRDGEKPVKAQFSVTVSSSEEEGETERQYLSFCTVKQSPDFRRQMAHTALVELNNWVEKYRALELSEFNTVFTAADKIRALAEGK